MCRYGRQLSVVAYGNKKCGNILREGGLEASLSFLRYSNRLGSALFVVVAGHNEVLQAENVRAVLFVRPEPTPSLWGPLCR
jgi:hypothetical protein